MKKFISSPISSDLLVIELSEETILKLSIEEILEQIKFYEGEILHINLITLLHIKIRYLFEKRFLVEQKFYN